MELYNMKNTGLAEFAKILARYSENNEVVADIVDDVCNELIKDEDVKTWFYNRAGIIRPENMDEHSIS